MLALYRIRLLLGRDRLSTRRPDVDPIKVQGGHSQSVPGARGHALFDDAAELGRVTATTDGG